MGKTSSRPLISDDTIKRKLSVAERKRFQRMFKKIAETSDVNDGRIEKDVFFAMYLMDRLPELSPLVLERLWQVFTFRGKDDMNYDEFRQVMYLLEHIPSEPVVGDLTLEDLELAVQEDRLRCMYACLL